MSDRERLYNLVNTVCDYSIKEIDKITELKQENSELKKRVAELEKPKKKRKFRAMTCQEFCSKRGGCQDCPEYNADTNICNSFMREPNCTAPYRTKDDKYILIEVKED